jgi:hypothetical protein
MPTTVIASIGSRTADSVTVNSVTTTTVTGYSNAWSVVLSATVPSTTKIGDKLTTGANNYLITGISSATLTAVGDAGVAFSSTSTPSTGSATTARSYSSIVNWTAGTTSSLVSKDWIWKGELYKEGGGTNGEWSQTVDNPVSLTCDSTRYVWLTTASGQSFADNASKLTNPLTYNNANGVAILLSSAAGILFSSSGSAIVQVTGLQIRKSNADWVITALGTASYFNGCIIRNEYNYIGYGNISLYNCFLQTTSGYMFGGVAVSSRGINGNLINNTLYSSANGNAVEYNNYFSGSAILRNNAFFGFAAITNNTGKITTASSAYNATDLSAFGWTATGNLVSKTTANQFQSTGSGTEDFRVKAGADLINAGTRDQTYTNDLDIVGSARSTTTPTIGAWEYASAAVTIYEFASFSRGIGRGIARGIA